MSWTVERHAAGSAAELHGRELPDLPGRAAWVHDVARPALVLGSAQPDDVVDRAACSAAGVEVVRRRSGGGAVLLEPGGVLWVDLILPRDDPLWDDDVGRAAHWVGRLWAAALRDIGAGSDGAPLADVAVHTGPMVRAPWSELVCFAGLGPGEVVVGAAKVVGVSQRRSRAGARFQCAVLAAWRPDLLVRLLALSAEHRARATDELAASALGVGQDRLAPLLDAFLAHLPGGGDPNAAPR